jgi:hypothetical protein
VSGGQFTNSKVQEPLDDLSGSAAGESKRQEREEPQTALSNLKGHVEALNGVATLTGVSFAIPGGSARLRGTFNLLNRALDFQGVLETDGKLADATSGFKALVVKAITPFLKKNRVTTVPFTIKGTSSHPQFGLDFAAKRMH